MDKKPKPLDLDQYTTMIFSLRELAEIWAILNEEAAMCRGAGLSKSKQIDSVLEKIDRVMTEAGQ